MDDTTLTILLMAATLAFLVINLYGMGFIASYFVWKAVLTRSHGKNGKWSRVCTAPNDKEQVFMWETGLKFWKDHEDKHKEIRTKADGLNLVGDYFDFGSKDTAIIIPGRNETGIYSLYFANPYYEMGMNILVFDPRAHGLSEGEYSSCGLKERNDLKAFIEYANKELGAENVYLHGICIGGGAIVNLMSSEDRPSCVKGIVCDGLYVSYLELFRNHLTEGGHPTFPTLSCIRWIMKFKLGVDLKEARPIDDVRKLNVPTLLLEGVHDTYSKADRSQYLYEAIASKKRMVLFEKGNHSHLKINDEGKYASSIKEFLSSL